jgi:L-amino acid N-acyltransferase
MHPIACNFDDHAALMLEIFNDAILNSTALYEYKPRTIETMRAWFAAKAQGGFPVIGLQGDAGEFMGFASYGSFRAFPAFKYTVEHSVYAHPAHRGKGVGERLLTLVIDAAQAQGVHVLVGGICASNAASIALHQKLGFTHSGTITQAGFKFGRWLDLAFYQRTLNTPEQPVDG